MNSFFWFAFGALGAWALLCLGMVLGFFVGRYTEIDPLEDSTWELPTKYSQKSPPL